MVVYMLLVIIIIRRMNTAVTMHMQVHMFMAVQVLVVLRLTSCRMVKFKHLSLSACVPVLHVTWALFQGLLFGGLTTSFCQSSCDCVSMCQVCVGVLCMWKMKIDQPVW